MRLDIWLSSPIYLYKIKTWNLEFFLNLSRSKILTMKMKFVVVDLKYDILNVVVF